MTSTQSPAKGRLLIVTAALFWSLSGAFTKALTQPTFLGLNEPPIEPLYIASKDVPIQIACYRMLFAGIVLLPTLRRGDLQFRPLMLLMLAAFALMNAAFITAQALGTAANAILLQYSAPLWMYLVALWGGEPTDRRATLSLILGLLGIGIIVVGGWEDGELSVVAIGLFSGFTYAVVVLCLRGLRQLSASWLTVWNHLLGGLVLLPLLVTLRPPTWQQYLTLFLFGAVQLGLGYLLVARGLRSVSAQEAGTLTLLEPILVPVWTYFVSGEVPHPLTYVGGSVILAGLAYRYWPRGKE
jgi:drug/metabolite transporter (DMT)-like permease